MWIRFFKIQTHDWEEKKSVLRKRAGKGFESAHVCKWEI